MSIDVKIISQLRDMTGAGVGDCKQALEESGGNIDQAIEFLRKKGELKAAKKSDRITREGVVSMAKADDAVATVVLLSETDFVARNEDFIQAASGLADKLLVIKNEEEFQLEAEKVITNELIVKIGESLKLGDFGVVSGEVLGTYVHSNNKVAAVVSLVGGSRDLANEIAMQVVAMRPKYLKPQDVPQSELDKEKEIYLEQLKKEGKPENILDKIIEGKLNKYYEEVCLLNQEYIKDEDKTISDLLKEGGAEIKEFILYSV